MEILEGRVQYNVNRNEKRNEMDAEENEGVNSRRHEHIILNKHQKMRAKECAASR